MSASTLRADALVKRFKKRTVVREVSLRIEAGEIVGLLGPNGAGKTTSFYMIVGLVPADSGRIELDGRDITRLPMHARARLGIGYLPQEASVFRTLSVEDNIQAILELREDLKRAERKQELERLLGELHITHIRDAEGQALSGGERRRVEIARALAANPKFILLDEPFAGVDPIAVGDIQGIVRQLSARGIGVLITDHNVRETLGICGRAYILAEGRVIAEGRPDALLHDDTVRRVYLGDSFRL
ncbi:LPS export ABC transporter ATP-binding protein [Sinimarinibacterium thermocellulolyticum]|uniref:Lipopolysaccharide export system ATP-binding protein LptB n=1 Tax=Sinimarinibacterium thermocellulolyticum TaxID=3170016 RepID=A0ABV2AD38_9GAMM